MRYKEKKLIGISLILTISIVFLLAVSVAEAGEEDYTISELQQKFNAYLNLKYPSGIIDSGNMEPYLYDPYLAGFNSMYEATQNKSYIDLSLKNAENLFSRLVDVDHDGYREWVSDSPNSWWAGVDHDNNPDTPNISTCGSMLRGARQVAKLVRLIKNDNLLNKEYGNRADLLIFAIKNDILYHPT